MSAGLAALATAEATRINALDHGVRQLVSGLGAAVNPLFGVGYRAICQHAGSGDVEHLGEPLAEYRAAVAVLVEQFSDEIRRHLGGPLRDLAPRELAAEAISLFIEYRDRHGLDERAAAEHAAHDIAEGAAVILEPQA